MSRKRQLGKIQTGPRDATDCFGDTHWRTMAETSLALDDAWRPPNESPWSSHHRPTLFAALDSVPTPKRWPHPVAGFNATEAPRSGPPWLDGRTAVLIDLPGEHTVAWSAWMARVMGHETISTFNNWPHEKGVVPMDITLGALLHFSPWAQAARDKRRVDNVGHPRPWPPVFMLDRRRLARQPPPGRFDNRYYLLDADLPTAAAMHRAGLSRLVYAHPLGENGELDDLNRYLHDMAKKFPLERVGLSTTGWEWGSPTPFAPAIRKTPFTTVKDPSFRGFRRSGAGGFGAIVPEPSSGGG